MIDDDTMTSFPFASSDPHPTVIVELATLERLHRVSALYKMQAGQLDVYLLNELASNPGDLTGAKHISSVKDRDAQGKAAVNFDPHGARYVALRWTPAAGNAQGFEMAEINAFGDMPLSMLNTSGALDVYASNTVPTRLSGESGPDFSNEPRDTCRTRRWFLPSANRLIHLHDLIHGFGGGLFGPSIIIKAGHGNFQKALP